MLALLFCLLLAGGCAPGLGGGSSRLSGFSLPTEDTGPPLNHTEIAAMHTTGHVDKGLSAAAMRDVEREYKRYLRTHRKVIHAASQRAQPYMDQVRATFRSHGMPEELAWLGIVESGYRCEARSSAGAAGVWQFMPRTGQQYGLTQDWWSDDRLDVLRSTEAAAAYLRELHGDFGDWPTAIAAYNAGEGKLGRALRGTGSRDFFAASSRNHMLDDKEQLRAETVQYVPRFLAVAKIMRNLPQLGFDGVRTGGSPGMARLTAPPGTDLSGLADACRLSREDFAAHNRHHKRSITDTGRTTFVYVPEKHAGQAQAFLASEKNRQYAGWGAVQVQSGADSWKKISRRTGVSVAALRAVNPGAESLRAGQTILVPRSADMSAAAVAALDSRPARPAPKGAGAGVPAARSRQAEDQGGRVHRLVAGESLGVVARMYRVDTELLRAYNRIEDPRRLRAGLLLRIPGAAEGAAAAGSTRQMAENTAGGGNRQIHTVQDRDSLWKIARTYNVSVEDLKRWNSVDEKNLRVGASLVVRP